MHLTLPKAWTLVTVSACALALLAAPVAAADEPARLLPTPTAPAAQAAATTETAVLAGGCFWGVEAVFEHVRGVRSVRSGYAGDTQNTANYDAVSSGRTRHAEAVEITFDPRVVSYGELLQIFFSVATDGTQLNRQGPDHGPQYRSNVFFANADQERIARAYILQLNTANIYRRPIVTRIDPLTRFYAAESYHQNYLPAHLRQPYIVANDLPKLANLQRFFPAHYVAAASG